MYELKKLSYPESGNVVYPIVPCAPGEPKMEDRSLEPASFNIFSNLTSKLICWFLPIRKLDNSCFDL